MNSQIRTEAVDRMMEAVLTLRDKEECYRFFEDLCTVQELLSMSQRLAVADMLTRHKTYMEITEKTGASTATISRVNRTHRYGEGGWKLVLDRLDGRE